MMGIFRMYCLLLSVTFLSAALLGCSRSSSTSSGTMDEMHATGEGEEMESEITAALAELPEEDRVAAQAQKFCAVAQDSVLGSMGTPFKLMIEDQPVFLCCEGCKDAALANPKQMLASVQQLKSANGPRGSSDSTHPE